MVCRFVLAGHLLAITACGSVQNAAGDAAPDDDMVTLSVGLAGSGKGAVASSPAGIDCGVVCTGMYPANTVVTLTATAATGSTFTGWGGGCSGTGTCKVTLNTSIATIATFTLEQLTLTVTRSGTGSGTISSVPAGINCGDTCSAAFDFGTSVALTAVPADDVSRFIGWSGGGCSGNTSCAVALTSSTTVTANIDRRGVLYMIRDSDDMLQRMDPVTLAITNIGVLGSDFAFGDCAWNMVDSTLYVVQGSAANLYRVNTTTGAATLIGAHGINAMRGLAFNRASGLMYAHGSGSLFTVNLSTASATLVRASAIGVLDALSWDSTRNRMVAVLANPTDGTLFALNLSTGAATNLAAAGPLDNTGLTYDSVIDRHWGVDFTGRLFQLDPGAGLTRSDFPNIMGGHTCIAFRP
jgi:hypothetical protein